MRTKVCTKCGREISDAPTKCPLCSTDRPAGLSEEERAGFDALVAAQAACGEELWSLEEFVKDTEVRKIVVAFTRAARAPFEAEMAKLREKVRELEDGTIGQLSAELRATCEQRDHLAKDYDFLQGKARGLEAQLAQQKPASPAGLPKVGEPVEVRFYGMGGYGPWHPASVLRHREQYVFDCMEPDGKVCTRILGDEDVTWRRLPPRADEPGATVVPSSVENHLNVFAPAARKCSHDQGTAGVCGCDASGNPAPTIHYCITCGEEVRPAASQPGEVSMENMGKVARYVWGDDGQSHRSGTGGWCAFNVAVDAAEADIRAAVAAEREKWEAEIFQVRNALIKEGQERDAALAEVERLKGELARAKEFQATVRDADRRLRFTCEANVPPPRRFYETVMAAMANLEPAPAQPECKVQSQPQDEVFCGKCPEVVPASMTRGLKECRIHGEILNSEHTDAPKRCRQCLGRDPGAKGEG